MLKIVAFSIMILLFSACANEDGSTRNIIAHAQESDSSVTYICVGDSTRASSYHEGQYLFYELYNALSKEGITPVLMASSGQSLHAFNTGDGYPTVSDVIARIPEDGSSTIVDISLGINDRYHDSSVIRRDLLQSIQKIRRYRPETNFILTTPNRLYYEPELTQKLRNVYHDSAEELYIGLNSVVDSLMPSVDSTPREWFQEDGIHLSREGQHEVAQFILENMI